MTATIVGPYASALARLDSPHLVPAVLSYMAVGAFLAAFTLSARATVLTSAVQVTLVSLLAFDPRMSVDAVVISGTFLATTAAVSLLAGLGVEPLGNAFSGLELTDAFRNRIVAVKLALMDQKLVVGVGNIYASEALFRSGIGPGTPRARDHAAAVR